MTKTSLIAIFTMQIIWLCQANAEVIALTCMYDDKNGQFSLEIDDNHVIKDGYLIVDANSKVAKPTISDAFITWKSGTYSPANRYQTAVREGRATCEKTEGGSNKLSVDR
jgi:hypothetical protein